ncbi:MAG TPA: serine/threonine-protein kinase, partial [Gemmatimonadales bacterium]
MSGAGSRGLAAGLQPHWKKIDWLLDQALDQEADTWPELLAQIRREQPDVAPEVERLLTAITTQHQFLEQSAPAYAAPFLSKMVESDYLPPGTALGSYEIAREIGRGGTAPVYLAQDRKHDRRVAVKVPHAELAALIGPDLFHREIRIAARLQHPNILPLHDSGEVDGVLYYVMPYVEGESLRQRLVREGRLAVSDALHIARQVADALAYAHAHGIVHRDIKPENILLSGGHALVADFGIARAITVAGGERLHETGPLGTIAYMSPEQAAADPLVDGRSDIYSLGCVLYEMLVGRPPFNGSSAESVLASHLSEPPPDPRHLRPDVPLELKEAVATAMAKRPGDRYLSAAGFSSALGRAGAPRTGSGRSRIRSAATRVLLPAMALGVVARVVPGTAGDESPSVKVPRIAVLYFRDLSPDSSLGRVADRVTEDLIYELSGVNGLRVISSTGVRPFRRG